MTMNTTQKRDQRKERIERDLKAIPLADRVEVGRLLAKAGINTSEISTDIMDELTISIIKTSKRSQEEDAARQENKKLKTEIAILKSNVPREITEAAKVKDEIKRLKHVIMMYQTSGEYAIGALQKEFKILSQIEKHIYSGAPTEDKVARALDKLIFKNSVLNGKGINQGGTIKSTATAEITTAGAAKSKGKGIKAGDTGAPSRNRQNIQISIFNINP